MCARRGQQRLADAQLRFEEFVAPLGEGPVSRDLAARDRRFEILVLPPLETRPVKRDPPLVRAHRALFSPDSSGWKPQSLSHFYGRAMELVRDLNVLDPCSQII